MDYCLIMMSGISAVLYGEAPPNFYFMLGFMFFGILSLLVVFRSLRSEAAAHHGYPIQTSYGERCTRDAKGSDYGLH